MPNQQKKSGLIYPLLVVICKSCVACIFEMCTSVQREMLLQVGIAKFCWSNKTGRCTSMLKCCVYPINKGNVVGAKVPYQKAVALDDKQCLVP